MTSLYSNSIFIIFVEYANHLKPKIFECLKLAYYNHIIYTASFSMWSHISTLTCHWVSQNDIDRSISCLLYENTYGILYTTYCSAYNQ